MRCPQCSHEKTLVKVTASFVDSGIPKVLRDRACAECAHKFRTVESPAGGVEESLVVTEGDQG